MNLSDSTYKELNMDSSGGLSCQVLIHSKQSPFEILNKFKLDWNEAFKQSLIEDKIIIALKYGYNPTVGAGIGGRDFSPRPSSYLCDGSGI